MKWKKITDIVIDITESNWESVLTDKISSEISDNIVIFCTAEAFILAKKSIPMNSFIRIENPEDVIQLNDKPSIRMAAAKVNNITVSNKYHPSVDESNAWLSSYHIELIEKILKNGFEIEICDEMNNVIFRLGDK
jgi:hypothetical protein